MMMLKTSCFLLCFLLWPWLHAQETKWRGGYNGIYLEFYKILKDNKKVRHGPYIRQIGEVVFEEGQYVLGKREGIWREYENGLVISGPYKEDKKNGTWITCLDSVLISSVIYMDGVRQPEITYYSAGMPVNIYNKETKKLTWLDSLGNTVKTKEFSVLQGADTVILYENEKPVQIFSISSTKMIWFDTLHYSREKVEFKIPQGKDSAWVVVDYPPVHIGENIVDGASLRRSVRYPPEAKERGIMGTVYIAYDIGTDGKPHYFRISQSVHPALDKEALRVVYFYLKEHKWAPASYQGKPVEVTMVQPVTFVLQ